MPGLSHCQCHSMCVILYHFFFKFWINGRANTSSTLAGEGKLPNLQNTAGTGQNSVDKTIQINTNLTFNWMISDMFYNYEHKPIHIGHSIIVFTLALL